MGRKLNALRKQVKGLERQLKDLKKEFAAILKESPQNPKKRKKSKTDREKNAPKVATRKKISKAVKPSSTAPAADISAPASTSLN